jgi:2-polyprenyl-6-methoxyphenol hydroxylase-like FAD-dependent oxidoreductase
MLQRKRAIVMGGSMAGLLATRVLSDHFEEVVLLERDVFPSSAENRRGVPQGLHTHGLLASGGQVLDQLFPGIRDQLIGEGAIAGDIALKGRWFNEGASLAQFPSGLTGLAMSRPFVENIVRKRVLSLHKVTPRESTQVQGLAMNADKSSVKGVCLADEVLEADLTLDATGRGSRTPQWLEEAGYAKPKEERVEVALGYTTRFFRRHPNDLGGDIAVIIPPTPAGKRGGVMLAQEGDRWTVTLVAHFGNYAPEDLAGFIEFARTIPAPYIYEVIRNAEPLGNPASTRFPASSRRRYEHLSRFPDNFLVTGDAICSFNPIYGQGMSVAALEAMELAAVLKGGSTGLARTFFSRIAKVVDIPWAIAVGNDLRMPETVGPRSAGVSFINWYMSKLHRAAHHDPVPALAFHRVANLLAPPPSVMRPRVVWRVLRGNLRLARGSGTPPLSKQGAAAE